MTLQERLGSQRWQQRREPSIVTRKKRQQPATRNALSVVDPPAGGAMISV